MGGRDKEWQVGWCTQPERQSVERPTLAADRAVIPSNISNFVCGDFCPYPSPSTPSYVHEEESVTVHPPP